MGREFGKITCIRKDIKDNNKFILFYFIIASINYKLFCCCWTVGSMLVWLFRDPSSVTGAGNCVDQRAGTLFNNEVLF